ncbi:MAG: hypothetical protein Q9173_000768 [Seirophora scorigena]
MVKTSKLLSALDAHRNIDHRKERQQKLQKQAAKRKRLREQHSPSSKHSQLNEAEPRMSGALPSEKVDEKERESEDSPGTEPTPVRYFLVKYWSPAADLYPEPEILRRHGVINRVKDSHARNSEVKKLHSHQDGVNDEGEQAQEGLPNEMEDGIPLSDMESLSSDEKGDIIPHQRLTINNASALTKVYNSIAIPLANLSFSEHQIITSGGPIMIPDVNDDLARELVFHQQCLTAAKEAQVFLKKESVPFSRPPDYFAEMIKSDEHMGKIKQKMTDEAANKIAAAEARKQRDLKKFGKQVQVARLQERDKAKRETLEKIHILKRSTFSSGIPFNRSAMAHTNQLPPERKNTEVTNAEETDMFDVALEDASNGGRTSKRTRTSEGGRGLSKRQQKDSRFGFGGKKRFAKSGTAASTSDLRGFSTRQMKGGKKSPQRLGKSRRIKKR